MPYYEYTMNIVVYPSVQDSDQVEGLCGNFNGDYKDDLVNRATGEVYQYNTYSWYMWRDWEAWLRFFYPNEISMSWE